MADEEIVPQELMGERTMPGIPAENYWFRRHQFTYEASVSLVQEIGPDARVLDAGCGEGYGAAMLAQVAHRVVGVDHDPGAIEHARSTYSETNLLFVTGDLDRPETIPEGPFDLAVALHVLDHVKHPDVAISALASRLAPAGGLYAATQNRLLTSGAGHARNPFLREEFSPSELGDALHRHFAEVAMWGVVHTGELLAAEEEAGAGLPAALIDAAASGASPPVWAQSLVPAVTTEDFAFVDDHGDILGAYDIVALARSPISTS